MSLCDLSGYSCDVSGCPCPSPCDAADLSGSPVRTNTPVEEQTRVETAWGLRLRTRIQELGEDMSANLQVLHPLVRPPTFEQLAQPRVNLNQVYVNSIFCLLRFLTLSGQALRFLWLLFGNITQGAKKTFQDEQYVFFRGSSYPYPLEDIHLGSPGVPEPDWYYNVKTRTFLSARLYNNSQAYHTHHIPYLAAEVKYNDLILYDISEFINSVRWAGEETEAMPNMDHLISAWTLSSGVVLKRSPQMDVAVINTDGNEVRIPLRSEA